MSSLAEPAGTPPAGLSAYAASIPSVYESHAADWLVDRGASAFVERDWLDRFVDLAPAGGSVLDLGCGAGVPVARHLIERGLRVTGVDIAPALVAACVERFPAHTFLVGDARTLALGRRFAGIVMWDSLFHLTPADQRGVFAVYARHAGPGCVLLFNTGPGADERLGEYHGSPLYHASLDVSAYRDLLGDNGFEVLDAHVSDPDCGGRTVWLARRRADQPVGRPCRADPDTSSKHFSV